MPDQIRTDEQYRAAREMLCEWTKDIEGIPYLLGVQEADLEALGS